MPSHLCLGVLSAWNLFAFVPSCFHLVRLHLITKALFQCPWFILAYPHAPIRIKGPSSEHPCTGSSSTILLWPALIAWHNMYLHVPGSSWAPGRVEDRGWTLESSKPKPLSVSVIYQHQVIGDDSCLCMHFIL